MIKINDKYSFLEKDSLKTKHWVDFEQKKTEDYFTKNRFKPGLYKRLKKIKGVEEKFLPYTRGEKLFFYWRKKGEQQGSVYIQKNSSSKPVKIIDGESLFKKTGSVITDWEPSKNGNFVVYSMSKSGNDRNSIHVLDIKNNKNLEEIIFEYMYPFFQHWHPDGSGFWYTRCAPGIPENERKMHGRIYFHRLYDNPTNDKCFFGHDLNKTDVPSIEISEDGKYYLITVFGYSGEKETTEIFLGEFLENKLVKIIGKEEYLRYGYIHRDYIYLLSNKNSPNWKIETASIKDLFKNDKNNWKTIIKENRWPINSFIITKNWIVIEKLENVSSKLHVHNLFGKHLYEISLPIIGSILNLSGEKEGNSEIFFSFSSFVFPKTIFKVSLKDGKMREFFKSKITNKLKDIVVKQHYFGSLDGTKVPMFVIFKKNIKKDGNNPLLCYGYGGFNYSITPSFYPGIIPFIENGGIYAVINIRGGGEFGERWHEAGKLSKKQNSFDDFSCGINYLVKTKYSNHNKIAIFGWSNGGLLTGVTITKHPNICKAAVIGAPVLDMEKFHLFDGGKYWIPEYGNPDNKKDLECLLKYSPYHNLKNNISYPSMLILTSKQDDRVHPMHAYKFVAKLRSNKLQTNQIILRIEENAGHSGAKGIEKNINEESDILAFIYQELGLK